MDVEHLDHLAAALELRYDQSLRSSYCRMDRHSLCTGQTEALRRLHPMFSRTAKNMDAQGFDQTFPCMCECHGPFEEQP